VSQGSFPGIEEFEYNEEVTFERLGNKPVFRYLQKTTNKATGAPMHAECGFLKVFGDNAAEFVLASPTVMAEIERGVVRASEEGVVCIDLASGQEGVEGGKGIIRGDRNKDPKTLMVVRRFQLLDKGAALQYTLLMSTSKTPKLTHHLQCTMKKV
jgi:hypothetical protein